MSEYIKFIGTDGVPYVTTQTDRTITLGTCSLCGGRVFVPYISSGVAQHVPKCDTCGALEKRGAHGRIVPMQIEEQGK